ncbi:MAG: hypothetical protein ACI3W8_02125 [Oscillospiraceae bacterium]
MAQYILRVVFSATPYRMGAAIRVVTRSSYNHVALALEEGGPLYSFARRYQNVPLCGGFVRESPLRYQSCQRCAHVIICAVPVTEEQYERVRGRLAEMSREPERYLYNLFSAALVPLRRRVFLPDSYTCVEFTAALLTEAGVLTEEEGRRFWSVEGLLQRLSPYRAYEGPFPGLSRAAWLEDSFPHRRSAGDAVVLTSLAGGALLLRLLRRVW